MLINIDRNTKSFAFPNSSYFKTIEWCKARNTARINLQRALNRFLERSSTSGLEVLILIPAMSQKQPTNLASSDRDTLIGSAKLVHPARVNYEKER